MSLEHVPDSMRTEHALDVGNEDRWCPEPRDPEGGCEFMQGGVTYGTTHGPIVGEDIRQGSYSGKMPFGLKWGDTISVAERKIKAITKGQPEFERGTPYDSHNLMLSPKGGYCLLTKRKLEYMMYIMFDENQKLIAVENAVLFN